MNYKILETKIIFNGNIPEQIFVQWDDNGFSRATKAKKSPPTSQDNLKEYYAIGINPIQEIAGYGEYLSEEEKEKHFPYIHNWSR